ncbi:carbohydrate ABC transporter permease [Halobacillus sp. H74]|uniref:carbohydrate ABC transporter permease n=1 Tax=Halobacillus sp. H74 TaxID=3457436 RepID=UPI003FCC3F93
MFKAKRETSDGKLAFILLLPSALLILLLIGYPMLSNFYISFFQQSINPNLPSEFIGFENFSETLGDAEFYKSLGITLLYTLLVVAGSTALGLYVAILFNRPFKFRKLARSLIILSYVTPSISLIFAWKYMFNNGYGIINYIGRDILHIFDRAPLWFDNPTSSFILVVLFAIWRYFPYAFIAFLAILQTISPTLYEAAEMDGANIWQKFKAVTLPAIMPVMMTVITLRTIWMFYMFEDVYLLTNKVNVLGIYLYETAFAFNDLGKASAISVILFCIICTLIIVVRKRVNLNASS